MRVRPFSGMVGVEQKIRRRDVMMNHAITVGILQPAGRLKLGNAAGRNERLGEAVAILRPLSRRDRGPKRLQVVGLHEAGAHDR